MAAMGPVIGVIGGVLGLIGLITAGLVVVRSTIAKSTIQLLEDNQDALKSRLSIVEAENTMLRDRVAALEVTKTELFDQVKSLPAFSQMAEGMLAMNGVMDEVLQQLKAMNSKMSKS